MKTVNLVPCLWENCDAIRIVVCLLHVITTYLQGRLQSTYKILDEDYRELLNTLNLSCFIKVSITLIHY